MSFQESAYMNPNSLAHHYAEMSQAQIPRTEYMPISQTMQQHENEGGYECEAEVSTRGEAWSDLLSCLTSPLLRLGFLLQLLVLVFGSALYYGHGGRGVFTFDLFSTPEHLRSSPAYSTIMVILESTYLLGCFLISSFQIYIADNSKLTRGFRVGSKLLSTAATLDLVVVALRLMQYIYAHHFLGTRWWLRYNQGNADWCLFYSSAFLHCFALMLYGLAQFYMEAYHDEGTFEEWSWIMLFLYSSASLFEFLLVFTGFGAFYTVLHLLSVLASLVWAFSFEPLLHFHSPQLHDRDINSDLTSDFQNLEMTETRNVPKYTFSAQA